MVKWQENILNGNSKAIFGLGNEITYNKEVLKSNLCAYNHAYILVTGDITVKAAGATQVAFRNCATFIKCKNWWNNNRWCWKFRFSHASEQSNRI